MNYQFKVYSYHPEEYRHKFYSLLDKEKMDYRVVVEETAPPVDLIKDIVVFTAPTLTILKILYDFYKETKKKKGKMLIRIDEKEFDLEAYNIEELKMEIESKSGRVRSSRLRPRKKKALSQTDKQKRRAKPH